MSNLAQTNFQCFWIVGPIWSRDLFFEEKNDAREARTKKPGFDVMILKVIYPKQVWLKCRIWLKIIFASLDRSDLEIYFLKKKSREVSRFCQAELLKCVVLKAANVFPNSRTIFLVWKNFEGGSWKPCWSVGQGCQISICTYMHTTKHKFDVFLKDLELAMLVYFYDHTVHTYIYFMAMWYILGSFSY
jgi:hypothetical protein